MHECCLSPVCSLINKLNVLKLPSECFEGSTLNRNVSVIDMPANQSCCVSCQWFTVCVGVIVTPVRVRSSHPSWSLIQVHDFCLKITSTKAAIFKLTGAKQQIKFKTSTVS